MVLLTLQTAAHASDAHPLAWLAGCWSTESGSALEVWRVDGDDLIGFAVTVDLGRVTAYETLSIRQRDGAYVFSAWPSNQQHAEFAAEQVGEAAARFTNPAHDFPQAITYRRDGNALRATISMIDGSGAVQFDKVRCKSTAR